jgi:GT2 family glycosyltransferase
VNALAWLAPAAVGLLTAHTAVNAALLRRSPADPAPVAQHISVLVPVRNEAHRIRPCLESVLAQRGVPGLEIVVLDDGSDDGTGDVVRLVAAGDRRLRLVTGLPPPAGWLGKPYACHQLATLADRRSEMLVFLDADVVLSSTGISAAVALLQSDVDLVCPYPRIMAVGAGQRLVQPLLQWSWLTFLPLRAMERSRRPSLAAAGGQFLAVRRAAYERAGGHGAVRGQVLEDIELARAVKRSGGRIALADGSSIADCRMYGSWSELLAGYTKSLWAAFRSPTTAAITVALLMVLYALPALGLAVAAGLASWNVAAACAAAYGFGVVGRLISGRATGARVWPDALAHPVSISVLAWLVVTSYRRRRRRRLSWRGRQLPVP